MLSALALATYAGSTLLLTGAGAELRIAAWLLVQADMANAARRVVNPLGADGGIRFLSSDKLYDTEKYPVAGPLAASRASSTLSY